MSEPSPGLKEKRSVCVQGGRRNRTGQFSGYFSLGTVLHHKSGVFTVYDLQQNFSSML